MSDSNCYNKCNVIKVNNDQFNQTDDQDNHKLNETCLNRQASNYCTFDNLSKSLPYLEIPLLIQQQKCNQQNISTVDNTKSVLENKSVTCIKDKEKNDIKLVDTCNFNARNVNENIEPLLIEQPLLNTNSTEDACICTNNTVVNIDLNESTDIVETVYNESVNENESTCSESIDTNNLNLLCLNCCGLKKRTL